MIQLQNVTKRIKENTVLDNVSYTFKSGFVYGLYGQNGSGKTMLPRAKPTFPQSLPHSL